MLREALQSLFTRTAQLLLEQKSTAWTGFALLTPSCPTTLVLMFTVLALHCAQSFEVLNSSTITTVQ